MPKLVNPPRYAATPARCVVAGCTNPVRAGLLCDGHAAQLHAALTKPRGSRGHRRGRGPLRATESPDPDVPRGTDTPDAA